jgi:predicted phage tail component-like protein
MTTNGFTFNGVHSGAFLTVNAKPRSIAPPITHKTTKVPNRPGAYDRGKELGMRTFKIAITLNEATQAAYNANKRDIAAWLVTDEPEALVFDDEPTKTYYARLAGETNLSEIYRLGQGELTFVAPDPYAYGPERTQTIAVPPATFNRDSVAYKEDGTSVAVDEARFSEVEAGNSGILIEEGTTNLHIPFTDPAWTIHANATVISDWELELNATADNDKSTVDIAVSSDTTYTASIVAGTNTRIYATEFDSAGTAIKSTSADDGSPLTFTTSSTTTKITFGLRNVVETGKFIFKNHQLEQKSYATTFVDGTRSPETLTLPTDGVLFADEGTVEVEFSKNALFNYDRVFSAREAAASDRFIIYTTETGRIVFETVGNDDGLISYAANLQPDILYTISMTWKNGTLKAFIDGVKVDEATYSQSVVIDDVMYFGSRDTGRQFNGYASNVRISRVARTDTEIADTYNNGFTVDADTTAYLDFEGNLVTQAPTTINNAGTAESDPTFRAYIKRPTTMLAIISPEKYMLLGQPTGVEETQTDERNVVLDDDMADTTGWSSTGLYTPDGGAVSGSMTSDGDNFKASNYGTGTSWHGPALKYTLPAPIQDFHIMLQLKLSSAQAKNIGRVELYLLDDLGNRLGKMAFKDAHKDIDEAVGEIRLGPFSDNYSLVDSLPSLREKRGYAEHNILFAQMKREGTYFFGQYGEIGINGEHDHRQNGRLYDEGNNYQAKVAAVQVAIAAYDDYDPVEIATAGRVIVTELLQPTSTQVPYIAKAGDVIDIDHTDNAIRLNGEKALYLKDLSSDFFDFGTGSTELGVSPADAATVETTFKERWL